MGVSAVGLPKSYPNQFSANSASSGGAGVALDFGFDAGLVRVVVDVGSLYVQVNGTPATTSDFKMTSGETHDFYNTGLPMRGLSYTSTSTTPAFRVGAWG